MHHSSAALRTESRAAPERKLPVGANALPGARRLLVYTVVAVLLLTGTVLGAVVYAVSQIDAAAVSNEIVRAEAAVSGLSPTATDEEVARSLTDLFALQDARVGNAADMTEGEVSIPFPGRTGRDVIWTPERLGSKLFMQLAPLRLGVSVFFLACILLLARRLYKVAAELERRRQEAHTLAARDQLTGLGNRLSFDEGLPRMLSAEKDAVALLYLDLDGFKQVNDTFGHGAGDDVLRMVGQRLAGLVRSTDMVSRIGGDEFAIVLQLKDCGSDGPSAFARRVAASLTAPIVLGTTPVRIGTSIGIAITPDDGEDAASLLNAADAALYRAKRDRLGFAMATAA
jgi:diguanylate cyclase (GGDEF)-like protein